MPFQEGYNTGGQLARDRQKQQLVDSQLETEEVGRGTSRLAQLETLQSIRGTEGKYGDYLRDAGLRDEERATKIMQAKNQRLQARQDSEARAEVDSVSRLDMAYRTNNQELFDATLETMSPGTRQAIEGLTPDQIPQVLSQMREIAVQNLDQLRKESVETNKAAQAGYQQRRTSQQEFQQKQVLQEGAEEGANYRARIGAGVPGMIEGMKPEEPEQAEKYRDAYIESAITKNQMSGRKTMTQGELNKEYDRSVTSGMEATAASIINEYTDAGVDIPGLDDAEDLAEVPGWAPMRTEANRWAKSGASGSDIHDGLMRRYLLVDKDKGFIKMPTNALGEPVGTKTALDLMREARDTGEDLNEVVKRYGRRVEHTTGTKWNHGL